jgi:hypothetical protein
VQNPNPTTTARTIAAALTITAMETKVAVNVMTRDRLMESPGPGRGHRGFRVQRNHESGGIGRKGIRMVENCDFVNVRISSATRFRMR